MAERKFEPTETDTPGPRNLVMVDIADLSIDMLTRGGQDVQRVWLEEVCPPEGLEDAPIGPVYKLGAEGAKVGDERAAGIVPAVDVLTDLVNEFGEVFERWELSQVSKAELSAAFDRMYDRWLAYHDKGVKGAELADG